MNNLALKTISVLMFSILALNLTGCAEQKVAGVSNSNIEMLSRESINPQDEIWIIREKSTGKRFIIFSGYERGGIAPLD